MLRTKLLTLLAMMCVTFSTFAQLSVTLDGTDPTCNGFGNGIITTNAIGGNAPFIYSYSNGFSGQTISGLSAGTYSVTVTDANNDTATGSVTLSDPAEIDGGLSVDNVCSGNGNVSANVTGGAGGYTYLWDDGQTTANATGLAPGLRCLTITDTNGCNGVSCITVAAELTVDVMAITNLLCFDACDASISANVMGGTGPYTYIWNTGATTPILESVPLGTYSVTVTDVNGCVTSGTTTVGAPSQIDIAVTVTNPACGMGGTGSATAVATGGTPPYQYFWSNGQMGPTVNNLPPGNYNVVVTDANGCQEIQGFAIVTAGNIDLALTTTPASACGSADGTASVTPSGGTAPYSIMWSTGSTNNSISGLAPGSYGVTVTDADGCAAVGMANIGGSPDLTLVTDGIDATCGGQDGGTAIVMAFDGTAPYTFLWSNGATMGVTANLDSGTYNVTVTDAAGCTATASVTITSSGSLNVTATANDLACDGTGTASATANVSNGSGNYTYSWSNSGNTQTVSNISAGTYTVTVTDDTGCSGTASVTVSVGGMLNVTAMSSGLACDGTGTASATANVSNGSGNYTYSWSNGGNTQTISNISAGTYTVTVTDDAGCSGTASVTVSTSPGLQLNINIIPIDCFGGSGVLGVEVTGGSAPFTYLWSNGTVIASNGLIPAGQYSVTVTDSQGCTGEATANLTQPNPLVVTVTTTDASCGSSNSGSATTSVGGGTAPYSYLWSTGATSPNLNNLSAGSYSLTVTDANGCVQQRFFDIASFGNPTCSVAITSPISTTGGNDGAATVTATGGAAPYTYAWSNGQTTATATGLSAGSYTVTVTDANGCTTTCGTTFANPAKLGDKIFIDSNQNGCQDPDEGGWFNLTVYLNGTDTNGNSMGQTTQTDVFGNYIFDGLNPGTYTVRINAPTGYEITTPNACGDALDSDANQINGTTNAITLSAGQCYLDLDIGISEICDNFDDPGEICCDQTLCAPGNTPDPITSVAPPTGGQGTPEYIWMMSTNSGPFNPNTWTLIPGSTALDYAPGPLYETTYFARCARRDNCTSFLETEIVTIVVETAFAAIINGPTLVCTGETVTFSATQFGPGVTYSWNFGSLASPSTANTSTVNVTWNNVTTANVTLTISNGDCTSSAPLTVAITNAPIHCGPGINNLIANVNNNGTVALDWNAANLSSDIELTVQRSNDGSNFQALQTMASHTNSDYNYLDAAPMRGENMYRIMMEDALGNVVYSEMVTVNIANSGELFFLYPNPFTSELTISIDEEVNSNVEVEVFTAQGKLTKSIEIAEGNFGQQLNLDGMPAGIYYVRFQFGAEGSRVVKVIKE